MDKFLYEVPHLSVIITLFGKNYNNIKGLPWEPNKVICSRNPLWVTGEVMDWQAHSPEQIKAMKQHLERLKRFGIEAIED